MIDEEEKHVEQKQTAEFEKKKIVNLNKFFMRNVFIGTIFSLLLFILTIVMLIVTVTFTGIDDSVKITIISMIATFILTTSKTLIDRTLEVTTYIVRLLGEEQRGFNKKIGVEIEEVEFGELSDDDKKES